MTRWSLITASNNEAVLRGSLLRSPDIEHLHEVIVERDQVSAAVAYNQALERARGDLLVFTHQDVFLPRGWFTALGAALDWLGEHAPRWAVAGVFGASAAGDRIGWIYSTGLRRVVGAPFPQPRQVRSLDEAVLVLRREAGLRFDDGLPAFHLYGTDICLQAERQDRTCHVVPCFCVHNSVGKRFFPPGFWDAYRYLRRKWRAILPVHTPCIDLPRSNLRAAADRLRATWLPRRRQADLGNRTDDVEHLYQNLLAAGLAGRPD